MKNDSFSFGLSDNTDDFRSYGMELRYQWLARHAVSMEVSGLTNRAAGSGNEGRYDELRLQYAYQWRTTFQQDRFAAFITPSVGLVFAGDLGFASVQEFWHQVSDIDLLDVVYDDGGQLSAHPSCMLKLGGSVSEWAPWFKNTLLTLDVGAQVSLIAKYDNSLIVDAMIGQKTGDVVHLRVGAGYVLRDIADDRTTHRAVGEVERALVASIDVRLGLLSMVYRWYPMHRIGYGGVGFSFSPTSDNQWKRSDAVLGFGVRLPLEIANTSLRYHISENLYAAVFNAYTMKMLEEDLQVRQHISTWMVGAVKVFSSIGIPYSKPFISVAAGVQGVEFTRASAVEPGSNEVLYTAWCPTAEIVAGMQFLGNGEIQANGVAYGLEVGVGARLAASGSIADAFAEAAPEHLASLVPRNLEPMRFLVKCSVTGGTAL